MNLKKLFVTVASVFTLAACGATTTSTNTSSTTTKSEEKVVKVGINASGQDLWEKLAARLKEKENIKLDIVVFEDYVQPNLAVDSGDVDINAFQTIIYLEKFNAEKGTKVKPIAYTVIAPMGVYSKKYNSLEELPEGAKVALPNDTSNNSRALRLLHTAGLIKLKDPSNTLATLDDIVENPKKLEFVELKAAQTYSALEDVAISIINSGYAVEAGLNPTTDAKFLEPVTDSSAPYYNVIAAREDRVNDEVFKTIVKYYQTDETKKDIETIYKGASIPVWEKATLNN